MGNPKHIGRIGALVVAQGVASTSAIATSRALMTPLRGPTFYFLYRGPVSQHAEPAADRYRGGC